MADACAIGNDFQDHRGHPAWVQGKPKKLIQDIRQQARAYIYAHGGCPDDVPADDMRNIEIMLSDGMIGPKAILLALSSLTTGNLNSKIQKSARPFTMKDVLPSTHEYISPPPTEEQLRQQVNDSLLSFMMLAPGSEAFLKA